VTTSLTLFQKAEAQLAYELQAAKIQQKIRNEEIQIQVCILSNVNHIILTPSLVVICLGRRKT
jgi:hypothetical protein